MREAIAALQLPPAVGDFDLEQLTGQVYEPSFWSSCA